ncbi:hypothetical protein ALC60_12997 [Trachymyrmex zeteki]|uniref:Uncharacterized protein n=1 Tax=Mycetomoellerius zeteki TaxID=64791 RepID=A0A151WJP4_9HYME|nr:hypothetical protein ALC60_12997 [Trachymyrmex zeteki]
MPRGPSDSPRRTTPTKKRRGREVDPPIAQPRTRPRAETAVSNYGDRCPSLGRRAKTNKRVPPRAPTAVNEREDSGSAEARIHACPARVSRGAPFRVAIVVRRPVAFTLSAKKSEDEARTSKHVFRWCIRHHKTGAL